MRVSLGDCVEGTDDITFLPCDTGVPLPYSPPSTLCVTSDCLATGAPLTPAQQAQLGVQGSPSAAPGSIAAFLASLTNAASGAVRAATTPAPYYVTGPNGQSVLFNPATGGILGTGGAAVAGGGSLMLLLLAGIAIFALEKR